MAKEVLLFAKIARETLPTALSRQYHIITLRIGTGTKEGTFFSGVAKLRKICGMGWDANSYDLLNVMCALRAADRYYRSAGLFQNTRQLNICVALTDSDGWNCLADLLCRTVFQLSGDRLSFYSIPVLYPPVTAQPPQCSSSDEFLRSYHPDSVCLFSGGADSFCGALHLLNEGRRPLLVSHAMGPIAGRQRELFAALRPHFLWLDERALVQLHTYPRFPVRSLKSPSGWRQGDDLQRLRSMFFFSLAAIVAKAFEVDDIFMCENGVIGAAIIFGAGEDTPYTTRPAEPHYLRTMQSFLQAALHRPTLRIRNPFQYLTKGEVLRACASCGMTGALERTVSCWRSGNRGVRNCGECVPCMFRQLAFHEAGLSSVLTGYYSHMIPPVRWRLWKSKERHRLLTLRKYCSQVQRGGRPWLMSHEIAVADAIDVTGGPVSRRIISERDQDELDELAPQRMAASIERFARATLTRLR